jgi:DNA (cytosine-5)-methyltransferase 1
MIKRKKLKSKPSKSRSSRKRSCPTVLDLFAGAGGFSEGFRSAGFVIAHAVEKYGPAVQTFNANFGLAMRPRDILYFEGRPDRIEELPDTDVIIGSPPCVSFSNSNKSRGGDKSHGLRLIRVFLAIVAVKKHKRGSCLKGWFMENVPNALKSMKTRYTFRELSLSSWAEQNGIHPRDVAVSFKETSEIIDAADHGAPQVRKRLFVHEYLRRKGSGRDWIPAKTVRRRTLGESVYRLPRPTCQPSTRTIRDPLHPSIRIPLRELSDHFYESGTFEIHWRESSFLKTNHPYMGRMSFPERRDKPSRTVVASLFPRARETLLYKSEWGRKGNGEYRHPTVREIATLMGFPITYRFAGPEKTKWTLIGNAVCPPLANKLARQFLQRLGMRGRNVPRAQALKSTRALPNLNIFKSTSYRNAPKRKRFSRFRRHPFKEGGMAVTLSNYDLKKNGKVDGTWRCSVTYGIGKGYRVQSIELKSVPEIASLVRSSGPEGVRFSTFIKNGFNARIPTSNVMQRLYENNESLNGYQNPAAIVDNTGMAIRRLIKGNEEITLPPRFLRRRTIPKRQLFALLAMSQIALASRRRGQTAPLKAIEGGRDE